MEGTPQGVSKCPGVAWQAPPPQGFGVCLVTGHRLPQTKLFWARVPAPSGVPSAGTPTWEFLFHQNLKLLPKYPGLNTLPKIYEQAEVWAVIKDSEAG